MPETHNTYLEANMDTGYPSITGRILRYEGFWHSTGSAVSGARAFSLKVKASKVKAGR